MNSHNKCLRREIRKMSVYGQVNLAWTQVDFDQLFVRGHEIKFHNFTTMSIGDSLHVMSNSIEK